jgi:fructose 5-dehydrogenase small subunit
MDEFRDDSPPDFRLSRRKTLVGSMYVAGALAVSSYFGKVPVFAAAPDSANQFMEVSSLLIAHRLNPELGRRLEIAMNAANPSMPEHISALLSIARKKGAKTVEDFFPDVPDGPIKATALSIISAWYTGVVEDGPGAKVFAYELALMYQPTRDVMTIPSYAISGPNGWTSNAPPLSDLPDF